MRLVTGWVVAALGAQVCLGGACAVPNPAWDGLRDESRAALRRLARNRTESLYDAGRVRRELNALVPEDRAAILHRNLLEKDEFLYAPGVVETTRANAFSSLRFSWIVDTGTTDPGEIDLFEDGKPAVSIDLYGVDLVPCWFNFVRTEEELRWRHEHWYRHLIPRAVGLNVGIGGGTTQAGNDEQVLFGLFSAGLFVEWLDFLGFEAGHLFGLSPDGDLNATQRDDSAWYYGIRLDVARFQSWGRAIWRRGTS